MDYTFDENEVDHPDDLDEEEEDVDGIRRAPSYPYHPCPAPTKSNKQQDPHQKYHHYNSYNQQQPSQRQTRVRNGFRSSNSSKENQRRNNMLSNNSQLPSQQKKDKRNLHKNENYIPSQKTTEKLDKVIRRRDHRPNDARNIIRRRQMKNSEGNHKARSKDFVLSPYREGEGEDSKRLLKEQNSALIKNHTKLMDQIMDDLIAEATDNEGQYYLDLAGNVRRVCRVYS